MFEKRKIIIISVLIAMTITVAGVGTYYWYQNNYFVATEDARVSGDILRISPLIAAKLIELNIVEGQQVRKGEVIGRLDMINLPDTGLELSTLRSPADGIVLKKQGNAGETVSPGQVLAMIVNPDELYVSANIEETKLRNVKEGQVADVTIDQYPDREFRGKVKSIGQATSATFSLLPVSTGGNFTKVVQRVPVKIALERHEIKLLPGTNAEVRIHVK